MKKFINLITAVLVIVLLDKFIRFVRVHKGPMDDYVISTVVFLVLVIACVGLSMTVKESLSKRGIR